MRHGRGWVIAAAAIIAAALGGSRPAAAIPLLAIEGDTGVPGGSAAAVLSLADDDAGEAVAAAVSVDYPSPPLTADPGRCALAARLGTSHRLIAESTAPGMLALMVEPISGTPALGNGPLATCLFDIALGTPAGTAALALDDVDVRDAAGAPVEVNTTDGAIVIDAPIPTPTVTNTPTVTATGTVTSTPPPSNTPTVTPTPTFFEPTVLVNRFGGCSVTPPESGGVLPLGLALLLVLRARRRR